MARRAVILVVWLGLAAAAVAAVLSAGKVRTPDLGGSNRTEEVTNAVLARLA